jgi:predicted RNase H-like nuclease (RuvC/YqgF family)
MIRWSVLVAGATLIAGAAFVTGTSVPPKAQIDLPQVEQKLVVGQKTGYFNMAAVMRDFKKAQNQVKDLNAERERLSAKLKEWKAEYLKLQLDVQTETVAEHRDQLSKELLELARKIDDENRRIDKTLNDRASAIISGLLRRHLRRGHRHVP